MKYCCEKFKEIHEDVVYSSIFSPKADGYWMVMVRPEFDCSACDWENIDFCPFCGKKLKPRQIDEHS